MAFLLASRWLPAGEIPSRIFPGAYVIAFELYTCPTMVTNPGMFRNLQRVSPTKFGSSADPQSLSVLA